MDQNHPPFQPANPNQTLWIGDLHDWMDAGFLSEFLKRNSQNQVLSNVSVIKNVPKSVIILLLPSRPDSAKKSYTIYTKSRKRYPESLFGFRPVISEEDQRLATEEHYRILATFLGSSDLAHEAMIQPFGKYYNGFSAFIHDSVAKEIETHPNVKSVHPTVTYSIPQVPGAKNAFSAFGNSDGTCSPAMTYEYQVARAPFAECFGNNSTNGWSKSFSNKG